MTKQDLLKIIQSIGFKSIEEFRSYMLSKARLNEWGAICYFEKRKKIQFNYSENCVRKFGIGGNIRGSFVEHRFD